MDQYIQLKLHFLNLGVLNIISTPIFKSITISFGPATKFVIIVNVFQMQLNN